MNINYKEPPHNTDAEEVVLGALLNEQNSYPKVAAMLTVESFYKEEHQLIYGAITELHSENKSVDIITVCNVLRKNSELDRAGKALYVMQLSSRVSTSMHIEEHALILVEKSILRKLIQFSSPISSKCYGDDADPITIIHALQKELDIITNGLESGRPADSIKNIAREVMEDVAKNMNLPQGGITGCPTGFTDIDKITGGWQNSDLIIIAARPGMGKLQPLTEPLLTPNGWSLMGDISKGSEVICPVTGSPVKVLNVYPQNELKIYKVAFSDGSWTECCNEHLWKIQADRDRQRGMWRVVDLDWMINKGVLDKRNKSKYRIPLTAPVQFTPKEIDLDPYILGLLISNGSLSSKKQVTIASHTKSVSEIFKHIEGRQPRNVNIVQRKQYRESKCTKIDFSCKIKPYLERLGLLGLKSREKFVPQEYLYNSIAVRKAILSGLMDGDGSCFASKSKKTTNYSTMSIALRDNVIELVKSLGGKAVYCTDVRDKYKGGVCYNISIRLPFNPFGLQYKREIFDSVNDTYTLTKTIRKIEYLRLDKGQCIEVDSPDHLYITRDYTVTHNTALIVSNTVNSAKDFKKSVAVFSLEMTKKQIVTRMITQVLDQYDISTDRLQRGRITQEELAYINQSINGLVSSLIFIDDTPSLTIMDLRAKCWKLKNKHNIDLIIVDYLQLLSAGKAFHGNREQEISYISRQLKVLAKDLNVPVIALSQLSRQVESRADKRPMLSDLRESGSIEADADLVCFIYRPEYYGIHEDEMGNSLDGLGIFIIAKHRSGSCDDVLLKFAKKQTKFSDHQKYQLPPETMSVHSYSNLNNINESPY